MNNNECQTEEIDQLQFEMNNYCTEENGAMIAHCTSAIPKCSPQNLLSAARNVSSFLEVKRKSL